MSLPQPKILKLLSCVQMCKYFSHYGIRVILILYMIEQLRFSDSRAFGVNALFCGLIELGGIFGGLLADRYLGLRRALTLGGILLSIGYGCLLLEGSLFLALGLIILGGSLFSSNIMALLGLAYEENDPRRKRGFTIFYMMQNLGACISTALCGVLAACYGFRIGFAVASLGMVVGVFFLMLFQRHFPRTPQKNAWVAYLALIGVLAIGSVALQFENVLLPILPWVTGGIFLYFSMRLLKDPELPQDQVRQLLIYLGALILFFAAEEQISSSLILFSERETTRTLCGWTIPGSIIMSINPIVILIGGALLARLRTQLITPFALAALAFGGLAIMCLLHFGLSLFGVIGIVVLISIAELMVGPVVSSIASQVASQGKAGMVMGMVPIAFSLAFLLGGGFSKIIAKSSYEAGFGTIAIFTLLGGVSLQLLLKRFDDAKRRVS